MSIVDVLRPELAERGLDLVGSCSIEDYDRRAPASHRAAALMPGARGVIVVASAGRRLWERFTAAIAERPALVHAEHPLDTYVASVLDHGDELLARHRVGSRRFEPTVYAQPAVNFRALGELVGLGSLGPFGLLIHDTHGPWWALRGAWLVDVEVDAPLPHAAPCRGCDAVCIGGRAPERSEKGERIVLATLAVRGRCIVGRDSRYGDEQLAFHYDRESTLDAMRARASSRSPDAG